ncbi:MAG: tetratricopeptide repeat protein [Deltaproteobacteria bacterium]|nr:MAG: tetratricopeptide repeat protein [Deltaproteobacteria bacterium]
MSTNVVKRKLAAILSADVEGYSRLMGEDEESTVRTLTTYREVMSGLIQQYRGRVVDYPGDNILAEFTSVVDAVQCGVEIQQVLKARNAALPESRRMAFRIGVNLGDVIEEGERIYGDGVNIAARLEAMAEAGGICISGSAYDQIKNKLALSYEYLGEKEVKNIAEPVRVYKAQIEPVARRARKKAGLGRWRWAVLAAAAFLVIGAGTVAVWTFYFRPSPPSVEPASVEKMKFPLPDNPSLAVLPFTNMSNDPKQEYFSDGLSEDLITDLSRISGLFVIARNSTFAYKGKAVKIRQVAEELGVRYVLEGSVRKADNRVRINVQLIDATRGHHLWAQRYDGEMVDVFNLQDEITRKIIAALEMKLKGDRQEQDTRKETDNIEAYDAFLQGWKHYYRSTTEDWGKAISFFEKAIELDPNYGRAYAAMALIYWRYSLVKEYDWHPDPSIGVTWSQALIRFAEYMELAMKNPTSISCRIEASMALYRRQWEKAVAQAERAVVLSPNDMDSFYAMAYILMAAGRLEEAMELIKKGMRYDPNNIGYPLYLLGMAQFCRGQLEETVEFIERALRHNPQLPMDVPILAVAYAHLGQDQKARAALDVYLKHKGQYYNIRQLMFKFPFKDLGVSDRLADGILKAGLPDQSHGYYRLSSEQKLTGDEIRELVFGRTTLGALDNDLIDRSKEGKATWVTKSIGWNDSGVSWIEDDMLCDQWQIRWSGQKFCMTVFRNPEGTPETKDEYLSPTIMTIYPFSLVD